MSKREIANEKLNSECEVDEDSNSAVSPNHPYSTNQFNNCLYSNKGKVFSHDLPLFHIERVKENCGSIESSIEEISIIYVSQKKIRKCNHKLIDFKNLNSVKVQKNRKLLGTTMKSVSEIRKKSSREILQDLLL